MPRAERECQHFWNDVEVRRCKEGRLLGIAQRIRVERNVVRLDARTSHGGAGHRADVREAAGVARRARRTVRRAGGRGRLDPFGLVVNLVVFEIRADDAAQPPVLRGAEPEFMLQMHIALLHRLPGDGRREAGRLEIRVAMAAVDVRARSRTEALVIVRV